MRPPPASLVLSQKFRLHDLAPCQPLLVKIAAEVARLFFPVAVRVIHAFPYIDRVDAGEQNLIQTR